MTWLTREALRRVLQSLMTSELKRMRRGRVSVESLAGDAAWPETLVMGDQGSPSLGCDSLELLSLAAATNEMFCLYESQREESLLSAETFGEWVDLLEGTWNTSGRRLTFTTSGSTGVPKRCTHEMTFLQREVSFLVDRFSGTRRIVAIAPAHHIYGFLFTALLPTHLGIEVIAAGSQAPGRLAQDLRTGDLVVSVPPAWDWLSRSIPRWPEGVHGVCSTAPCPELLKQKLVGDGLASFTEIYGSSETAGIALRTYPEERYRLMPYWAWADGGEGTARLQDDTGASVAVQDRLEIAPDGTFRVLARLDGAVQVGGTNVFPSRIEAFLRQIPGIADAAVRLDTEEGTGRLKAFIVADKSRPEHVLVDALEQWAKDLPTPERIRSFTFGERLPTNEMGKAADWVVPA